MDSAAGAFSVSIPLCHGVGQCSGSVPNNNNSNNSGGMSTNSLSAWASSSTRVAPRSPALGAARLAPRSLSRSRGGGSGPAAPLGASLAPSGKGARSQHTRSRKEDVS